MTRHVRAIFLSDVHLGTRACQADRLLEFLKAYDSDQVFLVGDIVDLLAMRRVGIHWTPSQNTVVQKILRKARHQSAVVFVPGNHDDAMREHTGIALGSIQVEREWSYTAADGRRYLMIHGDQFDSVIKYHTWLVPFGAPAYACALYLNLMVAWVRRRLGMTSYWSLSGFVKRRVRQAVSYIDEFERALVRHARERGFDGVVCGHIHAAAVKDVGGIAYINCGDWVDSCTAVVEHMDGRRELIEWAAPPREATPSLPLTGSMVPV